VKKLVLAALTALVAGCGIHPVKMNTADGSQRYFMNCGDDKGACVTKANELCPKGYSIENESNKNQFSFNAWHGGSKSEITVEVQCK
jgi:hypothetical protein